VWHNHLDLWLRAWIERASAGLKEVVCLPFNFSRATPVREQSRMNGRDKVFRSVPVKQHEQANTPMKKELYLERL
jgi:hypothetical protein